MKSETIFVGKTTLQTKPKIVQGDIVTIANNEYYKITNYDALSPFFMNIVSSSDLWMFISSNGALTAGRRNPDNALFPYYTDDQIHDSQELTGDKTIVLMRKNEDLSLWEPFSSKYQNVYRIERNIYKNMLGDHVIFEEINHDLHVSFLSEWLSCDRFGFIKKSSIINSNLETVTINILDGIQNILPAGVDRKFQMEFSTLLDGYKKNELQDDTGLALFTLSSIPTDKAEPSESLWANTVWSTGLEKTKILLSAKQLDLFRTRQSVEQETDIRAERGAYFLQSNFKIIPNEKKEWFIVADLNKDQSDVQALSHFLSGNDVAQQLEKEIDKSSEILSEKIAQADGFQLTSDSLNMFRHCSNTLFNIMRGGIFDNNYLIDKDDFLTFIQKTNKKIKTSYQSFLNDLPDQLNFQHLSASISSPSVDFERLCSEYLPLTFSRRHGDPSRPWNQFSIDIKDKSGKKTLNYQGNWRDIFQNWEALALSFPQYIENMITKFVNASTADGYNPYRITRDGFDWEVPNESESWSNIGYWGDHQIIYLVKLLELSKKYHPGKIQSLLTKKIFVYANVPYKIKSYEDILKNPHETIDFDFDLNTEIEKRVDLIGTDGRFIWSENGELYHVNLAEKLLVPMLVKFSNFIPEAGIWMNTQRPEWNDANNALVGHGASMVTLYYMRRFLVFCIDIFQQTPIEKIKLSDDVFELLEAIEDCFNNFQNLLDDQISNRDRKKILDQLGQAGSNYRLKIYSKGFSGHWRSILISELISFLEISLSYIDHTIRANKRDDDLYHAYNLINFTNQDEVSIRHMYKILEGQVAILSSGYLPHEDAIILLNSLRKSDLYREDQSSYLLYPNRQLPRFVDKNIIPKKLLKRSEFLQYLIKQNTGEIVKKDISGKVHFNSNFRNVGMLKQALDELNKDKGQLENSEITEILNIYESVFDHQSFTGRSGTFYKYEGLGSIYWHMVSKLLLAVQDTFYRAVDEKENQSILEKLRTYYYGIRDGIGSHKSPGLYGAFPTDPYSHTPENSGALQPGMTGQVKEDFISRFGELGVRVHEGKIEFSSALIDMEEFLTESKLFPYFEVNGKKQTMMLNPCSLAFTICQVPIVYIKAEKSKIVIFKRDGTEEEIESLNLGSSISKSIFKREDSILKIHVFMAF